VSYLRVIIGRLVDGVNEVRIMDAGPTAEIEKLPVVYSLRVVTTRMYVRLGVR
jgi:hypothetical protein